MPVPIDSAIRVRARPATLLVQRGAELANRVKRAATEAQDGSGLETSTAEAFAFLGFDAQVVSETGVALVDVARLTLSAVPAVRTKPGLVRPAAEAGSLHRSVRQMPRLRSGPPADDHGQQVGRATLAVPPGDRLPRRRR
jgi:hypothetical protein